MKKITITLLLLLIFISIASMFIGGYRFESFLHFTGSEFFILTQIRIPRILCAIVTGFGLALCGGAIQALLKNPLAEPSVIGISSGAAMFAAFAMLFFSNAVLAFYIVSLMAFCGAVVATVIVLVISIKARVIHAIILAGVAINTVCGGAIGLILFLSNNDALRSINFWMMGSFASASWQQFILLSICTIITFVILKRNAASLDILALGEDNAKMLGIHVAKLRITVILIVCLCVGVSVAFFGMIGFIGLVTAHIVRLVLGSTNKVVFNVAPLLGALILLISDDIARTAVLPSELPIGVITSLIGGPFFIYLITRRNA